MHASGGAVKRRETLACLSISIDKSSTSSVPPSRAKVRRQTASLEPEAEPSLGMQIRMYLTRSCIEASPHSAALTGSGRDDMSRAMAKARTFSMHVATIVASFFSSGFRFSRPAAAHHRLPRDLRSLPGLYATA